MLLRLVEEKELQWCQPLWWFADSKVSVIWPLNVMAFVNEEGQLDKQVPGSPALICQGWLQDVFNRI